MAEESEAVEQPNPPADAAAAHVAIGGWRHLRKASQHGEDTREETVHIAGSLVVMLAMARAEREVRKLLSSQRSGRGQNNPHSEPAPAETYSRAFYTCRTGPA